MCAMSHLRKSAPARLTGGVNRPYCLNVNAPGAQGRPLSKEHS